MKPEFGFVPAPLNSVRSPGPRATSAANGARVVRYHERANALRGHDIRRRQAVEADGAAAEHAHASAALQHAGRANDAVMVVAAARACQHDTCQRVILTVST